MSQGFLPHPRVIFSDPRVIPAQSSISGAEEEPRAAPRSHPWSVRVSRALGQLSDAFSVLLSLFISRHPAQTAFGSQHPSATTLVLQPCTHPWIYSNFMPDEAQALLRQLMDLKTPADPGPPSLASSRVEFFCRGVMVKSRGSGDAHPSGSPGKAQALPGGESRTPISKQTPKQESQNVLSQGIPFLALRILAEVSAHGTFLMATHSQTKVCPLHQICLQEDFCIQQRRKRHCKGSDETPAGKSG